MTHYPAMAEEAAPYTKNRSLPQHLEFFDRSRQVGAHACNLTGPETLTASFFQTHPAGDVARQHPVEEKTLAGRMTVILCPLGASPCHVGTIAFASHHAFLKLRFSQSPSANLAWELIMAHWSLHVLTAIDLHSDPSNHPWQPGKALKCTFAPRVEYDVRSARTC